MNTRRHELIMAVYPNARGFAFAVFEGPLAPLDWGAVEIRGRERNKQCVGRVAKLLSRYWPEIVVLQDTSADGTRRAARIRRLNEALAILAEAQGAHVTFYSRERVRASFATEGFATKQRIAEAVAKHIPMLAQFIPPPRKPWHTEHPRMGLFDAVALIMIFYSGQRLI